MPKAKNLTQSTPTKPTKPAPKPPAPAAPPVPPPAPVPPRPQPVAAKIVGYHQPDATQPAQPANGNTHAPGTAAALARQAKAIAIPAWLQNSTMPATSDREVGGYIGFASTQSNKWGEMQSAGLADGQPYLYHQQRYVPLDSLDFFLLHGESFKTLMVGREGKFQWVSRDLEEEGPTMGSNRPEPHYVCVCVVAAENRLIPIKGDFRGTKSGGLEGAIRAVEAAATPEWLALSDAHKVSAVFPQPFGRVFHRITTKYRVSKSSGNPYYVANCVSLPATITQIQQLVTAFGDSDFVKELNECKENFNQRISFLDRIATNGPEAA